jgi:hypothetical protein
MFLRLRYRCFKTSEQTTEYLSVGNAQYVLYASLGLQMLLREPLKDAFVASLTAGDLATVGASSLAGYAAIELLLLDKQRDVGFPRFEVKSGQA